MNKKQLANWEEWETIATQWIKFIEKQKSEQGTLYSDTLFRGQSCASWELETSLERYIKTNFTIKQYHYILLSVLPAFQTYTGEKWPLEVHPEVNDVPAPPPGYEFMVYLRHHGFPTPLLDWTRSPYIAAFFAFQNSGNEENVAIFTYNEYFGETKGGWVGEPTIRECGPYINSHKRHFQQQGQYTYCKEKREDKWFYCSHEEAFVRDDQEQDVCKKYLIPSTEKDTALKQLDLMNINAFSLYGNEEGLAEMLAYREIMKKDL